jgi:predicted nucleic acid-binding protein
LKTLLDTCVVSELRLTNPNPTVVQSVSRFPQDDVFLSVITMGEIQKGFSLLPEGRKRRDLDLWFAGLQTRFAGQILSIDLDTAIIWGQLSASTRLGRQRILAADLLIAASAIRHGLQVMTRNSRHFEASGALVVNPWQDGEDAS